MTCSSLILRALALPVVLILRLDIMKIHRQTNDSVTKSDLKFRANRHKDRRDCKYYLFTHVVCSALTFGTFSLAATNQGRRRRGRNNATISPQTQRRNAAIDLWDSDSDSELPDLELPSTPFRPEPTTRYIFNTNVVRICLSVVFL